MSNLSFSSLADTSFVGTGAQYLRPYDIYEVNLTKIEKSILKGKNGTDYNVIALEFTGCGDNNGVYTHNLFVPNKDEDFERRVNSNTGATYPSAFEQFQYTLMQLTQVINPKGADKIKENSSKIKSLDQFVDLIIKAIGTKSDVKFFLKLVGQNTGGKVYATLPNACVLGKTATAETKPSALNFVSLDKSDLFFSNYEMSQAKNYKDAKPTPMKEEDTTENEVDDLDDLDV